MQDSIENIKNINIKQIFAVLIVSCLLVVTTACSQGTVAKVDSQAKMVKSEMSESYDQYDANQGFDGGMNGYNDDRRYDAETAEGAKELIDSAKRRQADDIGDVVDNIGDLEINRETAERALGKFSDKLETNIDQTAEYIDNKSDKLQRNLSKVPNVAREVFDSTTDTAQNALEDATKATEKTAKEIQGNFEDLS